MQGVNQIACKLSTVLAWTKPERSYAGVSHSLQETQSNRETVETVAGDADWLRRFGAPQKIRLRLEGFGSELPVLLANGSQPGPVLAVTAAVHGDEFEGVRSVLDFFAEIAIEQLSGTLIAVPVVNVPAFRAGERRSPEDALDLARIFPGDPGGTSSQRRAALLAERVIARADFYLDLHSGGVLYEMPAMVGCDSGDERACAAAEAFGAPVVWVHDVVHPGRTVSFAKSVGVPWLYTEARGGGRIEPKDVQIMKRGIANLMRHLKMLPGAPEPSQSALHLRGDGNTDGGVHATCDGFLVSDVTILQEVQAGDVLGALSSADVSKRILRRVEASWR